MAATFEPDTVHIHTTKMYGGLLYGWYDGSKNPCRIYRVRDRPFILREGNLREVQVKFVDPHCDPLYYPDLIFISKKEEDDNNGNAVAENDEGARLSVYMARGKIPFVVRKDGQKALLLRDHENPWSKAEKIVLGAVIAVGTAAVAVAYVLAAPFAIAALGFGATGIVAGSTAAGMMSAGIIGVATLQSIGAAGMGIMSTIVVGGVAAAAAGGTGIAAATGAGAFHQPDQQDPFTFGVVELYPPPRNMTLQHLVQMLEPPNDVINRN